MTNPVWSLGSKCTVGNHSNVNTVVLQPKYPKSIVIKLKKHGHEHRANAQPVLLSLRRIFDVTTGWVIDWNFNNGTKSTACVCFFGLLLWVFFVFFLIQIGTSSGSKIYYALSWMLNLTWFNQILNLVVTGSWKSSGWKRPWKIIWSNVSQKRKPRWDYLAPCPVASWKPPVMESLAYPCGGCSCDWLVSL